MNNKHEFRYILYARKSTDSEDKQMASIEDQLVEMRRYAQKHNLNIVEEITEARSAKEPGRKGFGKMIEKIHRGEADGIICWKLNRLARNPVDGGSISWMIQSSVIKHIQTYSRDYWPTDNVLIMLIEFGMANQYVKDLSVDTKRGLRRKAERGWFPISTLPCGYMHNPIKGQGNEIIPNGEYFDMMHSLWQKMITGDYSVPDLKREGDRLGIRNNRARKYSLATYYSWFSNPFYCGMFRWRDEDGKVKIYAGKHTPMVSVQEFDYVQTLLGKRGKPTRINKRTFPFRGPISCGECGCSVTAEWKHQCICTGCKRKFSIKNRTDCPSCGLDISKMKNPSIIDVTYYHCTHKKGNCSQKSIRGDELEKQIAKAIESITIPKEYYQWAVEALKHMHGKETQDQASIARANKKRETELRNKLNMLIDMRANGELTARELQERKTLVYQELKDVESALSQLHERAYEWVDIANQYLTFAQQARERFVNGDGNTKKEILSALGSNVTLKDLRLNIQIPKPLSGIVSIYHDNGAEIDWLERKKALAGKGFQTDSGSDVLVGLRSLDAFRTLQWRKIKAEWAIYTELYDFMK